jgi:hypothetical protein
MAVERSRATVDAGTCLSRRVASLEGPVERRHEEVMEWAEAELGLERAFAEQVHGIAEEEKLAPLYAFFLIDCGVGVRELEEPEPEGDDEAAQQAPPGWVGSERIELDDVVLERRLRASFRRFRSHLASGPSPAAAVAAFLAEADVSAVELR